MHRRCDTLCLGRETFPSGWWGNGIFCSLKSTAKSTHTVHKITCEILFHVCYGYFLSTGSRFSVIILRHEQHTRFLISRINMRHSLIWIWTREKELGTWARRHKEKLCWNGPRNPCQSTSNKRNRRKINLNTHITVKLHKAAHCSSKG